MTLQTFWDPSTMKINGKNYGQNVIKTRINEGHIYVKPLTKGNNQNDGVLFYINQTSCGQSGGPVVQTTCIGDKKLIGKIK